MKLILSNSSAAHVLAKKSCSNRRRRCFKNDLKCSHTKVSTDHDCGNLSALAEQTQAGLLEDIPIDPELLGEVAGPASGGQQGRYRRHWNQS